MSGSTRDPRLPDPRLPDASRRNGALVVSLGDAESGGTLIGEGFGFAGGGFVFPAAAAAVAGDVCVGRVGSVRADGPRTIPMLFLRGGRDALAVCTRTTESSISPGDFLCLRTCWLSVCWGSITSPVGECKR